MPLEFACRRRAASRAWCIAPLLVLLALLSACTPAKPMTASIYPLEAWFPDPRAQALAVAAENGDVAEIRRLMKDEGIDPDRIFGIKGAQGMPLLAWPVITQNPVGLKAMLENGADPNAAILTSAQHTKRFRGRHEDNAMVYAVKMEDPTYLKILLAHGGDPDTRNSNGETLMTQAFLAQNQWQNVQVLVESGADINALSQGKPILWEYAAAGAFKPTYWLLEHGAGPRADGSWPPEFDRAVAAIYWHPGGASDREWQRKCQQWLIARGIKRPLVIDEAYRHMRENLGFPTDARDIPLL